MRVLLFTDDDERTWAARLHEFGADPANLIFPDGGMRACIGNGKPGIEAVVKAAKADAVLIDSWRRWAGANGVKGRQGVMNDESLVGPVADAMNDVAHDMGIPVVLLANTSKEGDTVRGSFSVEDSFDAIRTIERNGQTVTISTTEKVRHGIPEGPWTLTLGSGGFTHGGGSGGAQGGELVPGTPEGRYEDAALGWLMAHGESSGTATKNGAPGNDAAILRALDRLLAQGRVTRRENVRGGWLWTAVSAPVPEALSLDPGTTGTGVVPEAVPANGHAGGTAGTGVVPAVVPGGGIGHYRHPGTTPVPGPVLEDVPGPVQMTSEPPTQEVDREPLTLDELMPFPECEVKGYAAVVAYAKLIPDANLCHDLADIGEAYGRLSGDAVARWERIAAQTLQRLKRAGVLDMMERRH